MIIFRHQVQASPADIQERIQYTIISGVPFDILVPENAKVSTIHRRRVCFTTDRPFVLYLMHVNEPNSYVVSKG